MHLGQPRRPAGTPAGGQWAPFPHAEADISLGLPSKPPRSSRPGLVHLTPAAKRVIGACTSAGGRPLIVGGSVRDAILGDHDPKDIDIEVYGIVDKERFLSAVAQAGDWSDTVGQSFGVVKVYLDGESFDVSLPRRDSKVADGHRGFVVETADLTEAEAAARRDFTANTLGWDPQTEELVDCWGGVADIEAGVLRATSAAFGEDPLRVLRGMQFTARFGWTMDEATVETCASLRDAYGQLAVERVGEEWRKALTKGHHFPEMLSELKRTGWLAHFPELGVLDGLEQEPAWHPEGDVLTHSGLAAQAAAEMADEAGLAGDDRYVVVAAALLHDTGKATTTKRQADAAGIERIVSPGHAEAGVELAESFLRSIGCPEHLRRRVTPLVAEHMAATTGGPTPRAVRRLARRLVPATVTEWALVVRADRLGRGSTAKGADGTEEWVELARTVGVEGAPAQRLLRGDHLIAAGWAPGPRFKVVLAAAEQAQDDGEFKDEAGAVEWFERNYGYAAGSLGH
jgi:tRNA nucleotidyltransferase (CCA-adding enzyme)